MSGAMPHMPGLRMCREVFWRLVQPSAACTIQAKVLGVHRVVRRCREDLEVQAALGKAAQPLWMDPGAMGVVSPALAWDMLVARGRGSSDLSSCLRLWEASASLKASVPMKGTLKRFKWFGGFRALGESRLAINPPASCAESGPFGEEKAGGISTLLEPPNILPPCSHLPGWVSSRRSARLR